MSYLEMMGQMYEVRWRGRKCPGAAIVPSGTLLIPSTQVFGLEFKMALSTRPGVCVANDECS